MSSNVPATPSAMTPQDWWATAIIDMKPGMIRYRGYAAEDLIGRVGFAEMVYLMTRGELPDPAAAKLLEAALVAHDLSVWTQLLLFDDAHAAYEPKRLRYRLLHVAGKLTRHARQLTLHLPADWPWAAAIAKAPSPIVSTMAESPMSGFASFSLKPGK